MELNRTNDRCDASTYLEIEGEKPKRTSCGAQAYLRVETATTNEQGEPIMGALDLCRHHFLENEFKLIEQGFKIVADNRAEIENVNRLIGSSN